MSLNVKDMKDSAINKNEDWGYAGTTQRSAEGGYTNRYQWGDNYDYGPSITWMKTNINLNTDGIWRVNR